MTSSVLTATLRKVRINNHRHHTELTNPTHFTPSPQGGSYLTEHRLLRLTLTPDIHHHPLPWEWHHLPNKILELRITEATIEVVIEDEVVLPLTTETGVVAIIFREITIEVPHRHAEATSKIIGPLPLLLVNNSNSRIEATLTGMTGATKRVHPNSLTTARRPLIKSHNSSSKLRAHPVRS